MILKVKDLVKRYEDVLAVDNVSLVVEEGAMLGLLGPNGAGKTTLINAICGINPYTSGEIEIFGLEHKKNIQEIKRNIGVVPQEIALYNDMTAYENVTYFGSLYGLKGSKLKACVKEALEFTGLWKYRKKFPKKYSGGMKRRLNIACSIVHQPKLIIMDEPTVGIDPQSRNHILESVRELGERGATVIYTSHYMEEVEMLCDRIAIMDKGRLIANDSKENLKKMVQEEQTTRIELEGANYTMVESIKKITDVKDVFVTGNVLTVISKTGSKNIDKILSAIAVNGGIITEIDMKKYTLEDMFLTLTGRSLRDGKE